MKLRAVVGESSRLRDEALAPLVAAWTGTVRRVAEPSDLRSVLVDVDTPSLFGEPTLWVVRASENWLKSRVDELSPLIGIEADGGGALILVLPKLDGRQQLSKGLLAAQAVIEAEAPWSGLRWGEAVSACKLWITERLGTHPGGVQRAMLCADRLHAHCGEDADAILAAVEVLSVYADEGPITPESVEALVVGVAGRPAWEFSSAVLAGDSGKAIQMLHAGQGMDPHFALAALTSEVRKQLACLSASDDAAAAELAGLKGRPNLRMVRRQAENLGRPVLVRLLGGLVRVHRQLRTGGVDAMLELETLVLHARQLVAAGKR
jgi:DNA polymerase III delta subunit